MTDDPADLTAFQLADSFLPTGGYSSSYGLEQFVQDDRVCDASDVTALLETYLRRQVGPADLVALRAAYDGASDGDVDDLVRVDRRLHAVTLPAEFRESATRSGTRLCDLWRETHDVSLLAAYAARDSPRYYPVVLGAVAALEGLSVDRACRVHCHAFCSDMLGAAQRLCSLGHTETQQVLTDLQPAVGAAVERSAERAVAEMTPFAPTIDVLAAAHERAQRRLFVS